MPVLDTSVLLALFNEEDAQNEKAARLIATTKGPFIVPGLILLEFLALIERRSRALHGTSAGRAASRKAFEMLSTRTSVVIEPMYDAEATKSIFMENDALSYADAAAIAVAQEGGEELLTFDRAQAKAMRQLP